MEKSRLSLSAILVLALAGLTLLTGCQTTTQSAAKDDAASVAQENILRVGVTPNMPPFVFEREGKLVGLEIDFAIAMGNELGMKVRFVRLRWDNLIPALRRGKIDIIMSGMNYNPERAAIIAFANPYVRSGQMAMVLQKNASKYPSPGFIAAANIAVGAEKGTTGEFIVQSSLPKATLKTYSSAERGAQAVLDGRIELFIHDAPTVYWMAGLYQTRGLTAAPAVLSEDLMAWGVALGNTELLGKVNAVLARWNEDGAIDAVLSRWVRL